MVGAVSSIYFREQLCKLINMIDGSTLRYSADTVRVLLEAKKNNQIVKRQKIVSRL